MVKLVYAQCRHCGHRFIPRVEYPRQCAACWGVNPLKSAPDRNKPENLRGPRRKGDKAR